MDNQATGDTPAARKARQTARILDTGQPKAVCNEAMKCNNTNIKGMPCYTSKLQSRRLQQSAAPRKRVVQVLQRSFTSPSSA